VRRFVLWASGAGALLCLLALLACFFIPEWLEPARATVTRVKPKFTTAQERDELKLQAELLGESVFSLSYDALETEPAYLPERGSLRHRFLGLLATLLSADTPAAAREDVLPEPTEQRTLIDMNAAYPIQVRTVEFFLGWFKIGFGVVAGVLTLVALALGKVRKNEHVEGAPSS